MAVKKFDRFFKEVAANTTETKEYTPANGDVLLVSEAYGEAGLNPDTVCLIIWDEGGGAEEVLYCTHGSGRDDLVGFEVTGDGTKKLTLKLINDQATADYLGVGWRD